MDSEEEISVLNNNINKNFYSYGVWNSKENVQEAITKSNSELLLLDKCRTPNDLFLPMKLVRNNTLGKYYVANRNILLGEPILIEKPAVISPVVSFPISKSQQFCIKCCKPCGDFICTKCGFYFCGNDCLDESHDAECKYLKNLNLIDHLDHINRLQQKRDQNLTADSVQMKENILLAAIKSAKLTKTVNTLSQYCIIGSLRTVVKMNQDEQFASLMESLTAEKSTDCDQRLEKEAKLVDKLFNLMNKCHTKQTIQHVLSVWNTNGFEISWSPDEKCHGFYIFSSFFNHSCVPNAEQWFLPDGTIVVRSTEFITKGEPIHISYNNLLWPTRLRIKHLQSTKKFICNCKRCNDPTELGTFIGSVLCNSCKEFLSPIKSPAAEINGNWKCMKCGSNTTAKEIQEMDVEISKAIKIHQKNDAVNSDLELYNQQFHSQYYIHLQLRLQLLKQSIVIKLTNEELKELESEAKSIYETVSALFSTYSRKRAIIGKNYLLACYERLKREQNTNSPLIPQELNKILDDTRTVLYWNEKNHQEFFHYYPFTKK